MCKEEVGVGKMSCQNYTFYLYSFTRSVLVLIQGNHPSTVPIFCSCMWRMFILELFTARKIFIIENRISESLVLPEPSTVPGSY